MAAASSVYFSLPLAILQVGANASREAGSHNDLINTLNNVLSRLQEFLPIVRVGRYNGGLEVRHLVSLSYDKLKSMLAGYSLIVLAVGLLESSIGDDVLVRDGIVYAKLSKLKHVVEDKIPGPMAYVSTKEIDRELAPPKEGITKFLGEECPGVIGEIRDFIAHGGLGRGITCRKGDMVRYHDSASRGGVLYNALEGGLRKTLDKLFYPKS